MLVAEFLDETLQITSPVEKYPLKVNFTDPTTFLFLLFPSLQTRNIFGGEKLKEGNNTEI